MKLTIYLSDGGVLRIQDFDPNNALDLTEELGAPPTFMTFQMDDATVLVNSDHVVRIDIDDA